MIEEIEAAIAAIGRTKHTIICHYSQLEAVRVAASVLDVEVEVRSNSLITRPDTLWVTKDSLYDLRPK